MSIYLKHIIRNLEEKIGRTLLMVFSLFGIGTIVSFCITLIIFASYFTKSMINDQTPYNYIIQKSSEENIDYNTLKNIEEDLEYVGFASLNNGYLYKNDYIFLPLTTFDFNKASKFKLLDSYDDFNLLDNEIIIDKHIARKNGFKVNDIITYYSSDKEKLELKIKYISNDIISNIGGFIISNQDTYLKINNSNEITYDFFLSKYNGNKDMNKVNQKLYDVEDLYNISFQYININDSIKMTSEKYIKLSIVILIVTLIITYFVLNSIVKIIMSERISVIGSFRSLGANKKTLNKLLLVEMSLYGLIGGILGSSIVLMLFQQFSKLIFGLMIKDSNISSFYLMMILISIITILFLIIFQIILSIGEILEYNNLTIKECIFKEYDKEYKYSNNKLVIGIFSLLIGIISIILNYRISYIFGLIAMISIFISITLLIPIIIKLISSIIKIKDPIRKMAYNTLTYNKQQISTTIIMAVLILTSITSLSYLNIYTINNNSKLNSLNSDIIITSSNEPISTFEKISNISNIDEISNLYKGSLAYDSISIAGNKINSNYDNLNFIYSDNVKLLKKHYTNIKTDYKKWNNIKDNEVIVNKYYKNKYNLKINDKIRINLDKVEKQITNEKEYDLKIIDFFEDNSSYNSMIVSEKIFNQEIIDREQQFYVNLKDKKETSKTKKEIKKILTADYYEVMTNKLYKKMAKSNIKATKYIIYIIIFGIILIALIGIVNNQTVSIIQRTKHFAILYSVCMNKKQISKLILKELILTYIVSSLIGISSSIILNKIVVLTLDSLGIYIPLKINFIYIIGLLVVILIVLIVIYLIVRKMIKNLNVVEALKYE